MWAAAIADLGLGPDEFEQLTPRQFDAAWRRYRDAEERKDRRFANLMALYAESHRDHEKRSEPFSADDFMASERDNGPLFPTEAEIMEMPLAERPAWVATIRSRQTAEQQRLSIETALARIQSSRKDSNGR